MGLNTGTTSTVGCLSTRLTSAFLNSCESL